MKNKLKQYLEKRKKRLKELSNTTKRINAEYELELLEIKGLLEGENAI